MLFEVYTDRIMAKMGDAIHIVYVHRMREMFTYASL